MRIALITPGSGDHFYCENCRRDLDTVKALKRAGHDVFLVPLYLPIGESGTDAPIFYGAVNVYLEQVLPGYRLLPAWCRRLLDALPLLRWAAARAGSTRATGLEELTLSVLRGEEGRQSVELDRLVDWLREENPDIVHLSNALLLGLARRVRRDLGIPVVCSLQDEDTWVDPMPPEARERIWQCMAERAEDVSLFLPVSQSYSAKMQSVLGLSSERMRVAYPGVDTASREPAEPSAEPVLGYYSRLTDSLGVGLLVEAYIELCSRPGFETLLLTLAGGVTADDEPTVTALRQRLDEAGLADRVGFEEAFDSDRRGEILSSFTVLCVPVPAGEALGLFVLEALSYGVPVVEPRRGAFPEVLERTGGGVLWEPGSPVSLADALAPVLLDAAYRAELSAAGLAGVRRHFDLSTTTVPALVAAYEQVLPSPAMGSETVGRTADMWAEPEADRLAGR
jgi:glycosyltransferase involved in cell wall biosynthesis